MTESTFSLKTMLREGNDGLERYKNIIGVGVFLMFIAFSMIFLYTYSQERKIAEKCGFENEKIKCVCTKEAWNAYSTLEPLTLNITIPTYLQDGENNIST